MAFPNAFKTAIAILGTGGLVALTIGLIVIVACRMKARRDYHVEVRKAQNEYTTILRAAGWTVVETSNSEVSSATPPGPIDSQTASYPK
ncbi:hypothetical protein [Paraburkholderia fungorum]|jgi:hypothetical protein|uniref:hypothetical protein n=1 Tax=Paraburkholderia fungorum TaxID=134537 RepID=UPI001C1ED676|nr:hypothetical protein [Paraburkholderia fungorum]MBU7439619.1 hypothetical protein [Paraburkholderia fungorum]